MREYEKTEETLLAVTCNACGKTLRVENGMLLEEAIAVRHPFGYFSSMDGEIHSFDLCEDCYRKWISSFRIPVKIEENTELLVDTE